MIGGATMKRYAIAAVLAAVLTLGFADQANAQVIYGYNQVNPYTGTVMTNRTVVTPFVAQSQSTYYNPYYGYGGQQVQYRNVYGTTYNQGSGMTPYYGGYNYGYYTPGFGNPYVAGYRFRW
jgi:hypothetical protein